MTLSETTISVIVPVYNGASTLPQLIQRLIQSLGEITTGFEIVLVDDRGPEAVWGLIQEASNADHRVKGVRLSRNFGQHQAITAGIETAKAKWYVVMDCDLQDLPEDIPSLYYAATEREHDSVIAVRDTHETSGKRKLGSYLFNKSIELLADIPASEKIGNFRIFNEKVAKAFRSYPEQMRFFHALMSNLGFEVSTLGVQRPSRSEGVSSYSFSKLVALAFDAIIANSIKPLYYLLFIGFVISICSAGYGISILFKTFVIGTSVEGWASIMTAIFFLSGIMIFTICLVGIYVGQVFFEVKRRPIYIIQETTYTRDEYELRT